MGPVETAIRRVVREGDLLHTPQGAPFSVGKLSEDRIVLEFGQKRTPTFFSGACLEGVLSFLQQRGRVLHCEGLKHVVQILRAGADRDDTSCD